MGIYERASTGMECTYTEKLFAYEYVLNRFNGTTAYMNVFRPKSKKIAGVEACKLLQSPRVRNFLESIMKPVYDKYALSANRILEELASVAMSNIQDVLTIEDGQLQIHDTADNDPRANAAISEVQVIGGRTNVKMHDKTKALQLLAKYHGLEMDFNQIVMGLLQYGYQVVQDAESGQLQLKSVRKNQLPFDVGDHVIIDQKEVQTTAELAAYEEVDEPEPEADKPYKTTVKKTVVPELPMEMPLSEKEAQTLKQKNAAIKDKLMPEDGIYRSNPFK